MFTIVPRLLSLNAATSMGAKDGPHIHRTELDSHANMVVVGDQSVVFDDTGLSCTVNVFTKSA